MTCKQGDRHCRDESQARCLDCGRDAATIAAENAVYTIIYQEAHNEP